MPGYALLIQHKTKAGKRAEVQAVWRKHMPSAIMANEDHLAYFYCFGGNPDSICAFQQYPDAEAAAAFLRTPEYRRYEEEVSPLLEGDPVITILGVQWSKQDGG